MIRFLLFMLPFFLTFSCAKATAQISISTTSTPDSLDIKLKTLVQDVKALEHATNTDSALAVVTVAIAEFQAADYMLEEAIALKVLGILEIKKLDYQKAVTHLTDAIDFLDKKDHPTIYIEALYGKAFALLNQNDYSRTIRTAKKGLNNCKADTCSKTGDFQELLFLSYWKLKKLKPAKKHADEAIEYYEENDQIDRKALVYLNLAEMYQEVELYPRAFEYYNLSFINYETLNKPQKAGEVIYKLGEHFEQTGDYVNALSKLDEAKKYTKKLNNKLLEAKILSAEGRVYYLLKNYRASTRVLKKSTKLWEQQANSIGLSEDLIALALSQVGNKLPKIAIKTFEESIVISDLIENKNNTFKAYSEISRIYLAENNLEKASLYADNALGILSDITNRGSIQDTYELVSNIYEKQGKQSAAEEYALKAQELKDSLKDSETEREKKIAKLHLELEEANVKIEQIELDYANQAKLADRQKETIITQTKTIKDTKEIALMRGFFLKALGAAMILFLLLAGLLGYNFFQKRKHNERLKSVNEKLQLSNAELTESETRLQHFAQSVSHDFKNPINSILGFSELLRMSTENQLSEDEIAYLDNIEGSGQAINKMLSDLQEYAMLGSNLQTTESIAPSDVILAIQRDLSQIIRDKEARIETYPLPNLDAHATLLKQLLQNLIGNAIKYSQAGVPPIIKISGEQQAEDFVFQIEDNGMGISESAQAKVFDLFNRASQKDEEGSGIGLALCKRIVEIYGGKIWLKSQPNEGSTFYFTLPNAMLSQGES